MEYYVSRYCSTRMADPSSDKYTYNLRCGGDEDFDSKMDSAHSLNGIARVIAKHIREKSIDPKIVKIIPHHKFREKVILIREKDLNMHSLLYEPLLDQECRELTDSLDKAIKEFLINPKEE